MQLKKNYARETINFYGWYTNVNSERGVYHNRPYIVMRTEPGKIVLIQPKKGKWVVRAIKANDPFYDHIIKQRLQKRGDIYA